MCSSQDQQSSILISNTILQSVMKIPADVTGRMSPSAHSTLMDIMWEVKIQTAVLGFSQLTVQPTP